MTYKYTFIILHYCAVESTVEAIESIRKRLIFPDYAIVVVDNGSPDQSGIWLKKRYDNISNIFIILNDQNIGFARGNNLGYKFARENLTPQYVIIMNNDVVITQNDFLEKISSLYEEYHFHVLGPDVITPSGEHQNPHRTNNLGLKDIKRIIRNRTIILLYLRIKRFLHLEDKIRFVEKWDAKRAVKERIQICWECPAECVVLQGSCLIFSHNYIQKEEEAFWPETFMWMEEEILTYLCEKKGYRIVYSPKIQVLHYEGISTGEKKEKNEVYSFYSMQLKKSASVMKKLMKKNSRSQR